MRTFTRAALLALALLILVPTHGPPAQAAAARCVPISPDQPHKTPVKSGRWQYRHADVWLYGDSITFQTYRDLRARTSSRIAVDAWWGRSTASAVTALGRDVHRFGRRRLPDVVVMATGTNDLGNLDNFARQVRLARAVLPRRVRLVWVNVYVTTTTAYNAAGRILSDVPGVRVIGWARANLNASTPLLVDGIHVNGAGCAARNRLIRRAIS